MRFLGIEKRLLLLNRQVFILGPFVSMVTLIAVTIILWTSPLPIMVRATGALVLACTIGDPILFTAVELAEQAFNQSHRAVFARLGDLEAVLD